MRLQKFLSCAGIASRRKSEQLIKNGLVKVNGETIKQLGTIINPDKDVITYCEKKLSLKKHLYIMLNKPVGFITTLKDEFNRPNVIQLLKIKERVFPIGRLDYNTSGLLLLTNDGDLAYKLTHPKHNIYKTYISKISGVPKKEELEKFRTGIFIDNKKTKPAYIKIIRQDKSFSIVQIKISEGRNRQIRKMCQIINHRVIDLKRIAIGNLKLNIESGKYRFLTESEISYLKSI